MTTSSQILTISKDGASINLSGSLPVFEHPHREKEKMQEKGRELYFNGCFLYFNFCPLPLLLALGTTDKTVLVVLSPSCPWPDSCTHC